MQPRQTHIDNFNGPVLHHQNVGGFDIAVHHIAPGCVLMAGTPDATVAAVVTTLGGPLKPIPGLRT